MIEITNTSKNIVTVVPGHRGRGGAPNRGRGMPPRGRGTFQHRKIFKIKN
jgi:hypothetical protein